MGLVVKYKNSLGTVEMFGDSRGDLRITAIEGLGLVEREYETAVYSGYDGQETLNSRAVARCITLAVEICSQNAPGVMRDVLTVLSCEGTLFVENENINRRIECSRVQCPDATRVMKGQISTFAVQFTCDNPFFEDGADTVAPLYQRVKLLESPFSLETMFGDIVLGAEILISGHISVEPCLTLYYPTALEGVENITVTNESTGAFVSLDYAPQNDDTVVIDIKNRRVTSSVCGNLISKLSDDSFLGDFVLVRGINRLSVDVGQVTSDFTIECRYSNLYGEAVIV